MSIFGYKLPNILSRFTPAVPTPHLRLNLLATPAKTPEFQDRYHSPQVRRLRFLPTLKTPYVQKLCRLLANISQFEGFVPDQPDKAGFTTLNENGKISIIITLSDPDMLRWQARENRSWQNLSAEEQQGLISRFTSKRFVQCHNNNIHYTITARSCLNPAESQVATKSPDHDTRLNITKSIPFHLRRYVRVAPLTPMDVAFYNDPIFSRPPPKANIYSYKVGDVIFLPVKNGQQSFTITRCHKFRRPYMEIRDEQGSVFNVPKGYVDRHNPPTRAKKIRDLAKISALIAFTVVVPFASLILPLFMLKGRLRYLSALFASDFKARWRWNGRGFDFALHPGCPFSTDPRDPDTEKYLGTQNRYYHHFRQISGVLSKRELMQILPRLSHQQIDTVWKSLAEEGLLTSYLSHADEATATQFTGTNPDKLETLLNKLGLIIDERYLITELFKNSAWQNLKKPKIISAAIVPPPLIAILPSGHIRLLEHHRIFGAMDFGLPIAVMVTLDEKVTLN